MSKNGNNLCAKTAEVLELQELERWGSPMMKKPPSPEKDVLCSYHMLPKISEKVNGAGIGDTKDQAELKEEEEAPESRRPPDESRPTEDEIDHSAEEKERSAEEFYDTVEEQPKESFWEFVRGFF